MKTQNNEIVKYLEGKSELTVPMLQRDMNLSYDEARAKMAELEEDGVVTFEGGIVYTVNAKRAASAQDDDEDDKTESYIRQRRAELLERLKQLKLDNFNDENDDDDNDEHWHFDDDDFDFSDDDDKDDNEQDEDEQDDDNELAQLFRIISEDQDDDKTAEEPIDEDMDPYLTPDLMPYIPKQAYYDRIMEVYKKKQQSPSRVIQKEAVIFFGLKLGDSFKLNEKQTELEGWKKAYFVSSLYLPDGIPYVPFLTSNEDGSFFLRHTLIEPEDEGKLCVRQEFYMLLMRHEMFFGDCVLSKQFSNLSDASHVAMELYGALCEAKMLLDVI